MKNEVDCKYVLILSTAPDKTTAASVATMLVERNLVACVNLLEGVESIYRWQGKLETSTEVMLLMKTTVARQEEALAALSELHPYEVPEGLILPLSGGLEKYLHWVGESVRKDCDSLG